MEEGAVAIARGVRFAVRSAEATAVELCLFDSGHESRLPMAVTDGDLHVAEVAAARPGTRYGLRADGPWAPAQGHRFDPAKLLVDPHAREIDRRHAYDPRLALWRDSAVDTGDLVPKTIVPAADEAVPPAPPLFRRGGLIYEVNVRAFTMRHPDVPVHLRGTVAALAEPAVIAHLRKLRVAAVELMPVVAWIDERHLAPLGLRNGWGYNPVTPMALDPGLCPGGVAELRATVAALRAAGIGTILDLVFNHTGETDVAGPTLSFRGLDHRRWYAHDPRDPALLLNDTGTGNMLDCARPQVRALILASLRHFVRAAGVDGFRFDLATVLARGPGFDPRAPIFAEIAADPLLRDRVLIAEPWDCGPGGYRLGAFPPHWLEWNDRFRDDVRRFWRGDPGVLGTLATRLAGSADSFGEGPARTVNFLAAHDGFTLADLVAYTARRNEANGEANRDGHGQNLSWNCGAEGPSDDPAVRARRAADQRALLGTLFGSRGTIMLTAGDEFGRSQGGNNNAYAQDNEVTWLDWAGRDRALEDHVAALAAARAAVPALAGEGALAGADWRGLDGAAMTPARWEAADAAGFALGLPGGTVRIDRAARIAGFGAPPPRHAETMLHPS